VLVADVGQSIVRCPSHGHSSKTKQNRPMERYMELAARIEILPRCPMGRYSEASLLLFCYTRNLR